MAAGGGIIGFVVGIDPGVATGGMVAVDNTGILVAASVGERKNIPSPFDGDPAFGAVIVRAEKVVQRIINTLATWETEWGKPARVCIETFVDLPSRARHKAEDGSQVWIKDRWKTPLVIGMLHPFLAPYTLVYQNPAILANYRQPLAQLKSGVSINVDGEKLLTNDHMRTAWCHADYGYEQYAYSQQ